MSKQSLIGSVAAADLSTRTKIVSCPGKMAVGFSESDFYFTNLDRENWYPPVGLGDQFNFVVPMTGLYELWLEVDWPHYGASGVGWTQGYSGEGGVDTWMRWYRGGTLIEDNIARSSIGLPDDGSHHFVFLGPLNRSLVKGDSIRGHASGGATGYGPAAWNALLRMKWLVGGGGAGEP